MKEYLNLINDVLRNGEYTNNRTDHATKMVIARHFKHDMKNGFPLLTTKKVNLQTIATELEGFIKGITDKRWYQLRKCYIWDEWCNPQSLLKYKHMDPMMKLNELTEANKNTPSLSPKMQPLLDHLWSMRDLDIKQVDRAIQLYETDLGPIYGSQWRNFNGSYGSDKYIGVDQLQELINTMKNNPTDRRMIVSAWNPDAIANNTLALPPCHWAFEVHSNGKTFDLIWHQRSVDVFLGLPFNIASYALLMKLIEKETGLIAKNLNGFLSNVHIYDNHLDQIELQMSREPYKLPTLILPDDVNIFTWEATQWELEGYEHHPFIKGDVAV